MTPFSVLMSVYSKEKPDFLKSALDSIYEQTLLPDEVILVKDGSLSPPLDYIIEGYQKNHPNLLVVSLPENVGLGLALAEGLKHCKHDIIARMDTDDICFPNRFAEQVGFLEQHPDIVLVGAHIEEFNLIRGDLNRIREVPISCERIKRYAKIRSPFNHPTVVFRKKAVESVGSYKDMPLFEDYYLWFRLIHAGYKMRNLDQVLLYFRVPGNIFNRRHGVDYLKKEIRFLETSKKEGYISNFTFWRLMITRFPLRILPKWALSMIYKNLLRK